MNNEEFKNEFVDAVKEALYERGNEVDIKITTVEKMNESYEAMTITPEGSNVGMNMNLPVPVKQGFLLSLICSRCIRATWSLTQKVTIYQDRKR